MIYRKEHKVKKKKRKKSSIFFPRSIDLTTLYQGEKKLGYHENLS